MILLTIRRRRLTWITLCKQSATRGIDAMTRCSRYSVRSTTALEGSSTPTEYPVFGGVVIPRVALRLHGVINISVLRTFARELYCVII